MENLSRFEFWLIGIAAGLLGGFVAGFVQLLNGKWQRAHERTMRDRLEAWEGRIKREEMAYKVAVAEWETSDAVAETNGLGDAVTDDILDWEKGPKKRGDFASILAKHRATFHRIGSSDEEQSQ